MREREIQRLFAPNNGSSDSKAFNSFRSCELEGKV